MEIKDINIRHFGKFENKKMEFHSGLNILYGENEAGKSTICSFIRGMLFGIEKSRKRNGKKDEYTIRQPWENPEYYAGSMRFTSGNKTFFLDRGFQAKDKRVRLICEDDAEELDAQGGDLQVLLDDISLEVYNNTFFLGNHTGETNEALAEEIHNYMVNAASGNFSQINVTRARENLKKERKQLESEKRKAVEDEAMQARQLQMKIEYELQQIDALALDEEKTLEQLKLLDREEEQSVQPYDSDGEEEGEKRNFWRIGKLVSAAVAAAGMGAGIFMEDALMRLSAAGVILVSLAMLRFCTGKESKTKRKGQQERSRRQEEKEFLLLKENGERQRLLVNLEWIRNARAEKEMQLENLQESLKEQAANSKTREDLDVQIAAFHLAEDTIAEVMQDIYEEYEDRLNERVSAILSQITDGKYDRILVDEDLNIRIYSDHQVLSLEQVSRGTMEQIWFALRMAAGEILNWQEPLPIILDDAFLTYDDVRLKNTLKWLSKCGRQVLLFTCQNREKLLIS